MKTQNKIDTLTMKENLENEQVENISEYMKFVQTYQGEYISWQENLAQLLEEKNISEKEAMKLFQKRTGVDKKTVKSWMEKAPTQRKYVVWIAICLGLDRKQADRLLLRYAKFNRLYEKDPYDSILIFQLNNCLEYDADDDTLKTQYNIFKREYDRRFESYQQQLFGRGIPTNVLYAQLSKIKNARELLDYFDTNMASFNERNQKLIGYIDGWIAGRSLNDLLQKLPDTEKSKLNQMVSNLRKGNKFPSRSSLIVLGLALTMPEANINALLLAGGFEPLCPKDIVEGAIICAVEELYLTTPAYFDNHPLSVVEEIKKHDHYFDELCSDKNIWDKMLDSDETLLDYVNRFMEDMEIEEKNLVL